MSHRRTGLPNPSNCTLELAITAKNRNGFVVESLEETKIKPIKEHEFIE